MSQPSNGDDVCPHRVIVETETSNGITWARCEACGDDSFVIADASIGLTTDDEPICLNDIYVTPYATPFDESAV